MRTGEAPDAKFSVCGDFSMLSLALWRTVLALCSASRLRQAWKETDRG